MESYEEYKAYYAIIQQHISDSEDYIEKRTFAIASGGLTLSITILSLLENPKLLVLLCVSWGCFVICLLANLISHFVAKEQANAMLDELDKQIIQNIEYNSESIRKIEKDKNRSINILNMWATCSILIGVCCFLFFMAFNIYS